MTKRESLCTEISGLSDKVLIFKKGRNSKRECVKQRGGQNKKKIRVGFEPYLTVNGISRRAEVNREDFTNLRCSSYNLGKSMHYRSVYGLFSSLVPS